MNTKVLDCTHIHGGYYNLDFPISFVNKYLKAISKISIKFSKKIKVLNKVLNQLT